MRGATFLVGSMLVLGSCSDGGITTRNELYAKEIHPYLSAAAKTGRVPVVIRSSPFAGDDSIAAIIAALQSNQTALEPQLHFAASPSGAGLWIMLAFGAPPVGSSHYCERPTLVPQPASANRTVVHATFCSGDRRVSEAVAETGFIPSPQDVRFSRLSAELLSALMPINHPNSNYSIEQPN